MTIKHGGTRSKGHMAESQTGRFIGWQDTPIHQASFGSTTKGGRRNQRFAMKKSTGSVQEVKPKWYWVDASEAPIGKLATVIAKVLMGKQRPTFTPGAGSGDYVAVVNASQAYFTSNKQDKKVYYWHSGWVGGIKSETAREALQKHPERVIYDAVKGMMPKNRLSRYQLSHLRIFHGADHHLQAQKPERLHVKEVN